MGFVWENTARTAAGNPFCATFAGSLVSASPISVTIPSIVADGDLVLAWFLSGLGPTASWSTPTGWTQTLPQKNCSASLGGRAALFHKVWHTGDSLTVASQITTGSTTAGVILCVVIHADSAGGSLVLGNPPSAGFTTGYDVENTVAGTSITMPKIAVDDSTKNLRLVLIAGTTTPGTLTTPAVTGSVANPSGLPKPQQLTSIGTAGLGVAASMFLLPDPSGTEAGTTTWTTSASMKSYSIALAIKDPVAVSRGGAAICVDVSPFSLGLLKPIAGPPAPGVPPMTSKFDIGMRFGLAYENPTIYEPVYGTGDEPPETTGGAVPPDPDDAPVPPDDPAFTGDVAAEAIVISFTENAQDDPEWTQVGT